MLIDLFDWTGSKDIDKVSFIVLTVFVVLVTVGSIIFYIFSRNCEKSVDYQNSVCYTLYSERNSD